jgi:phosphoglycolate phosphatase-like HAD superfamily hydrolase
MPYFLAIFDPDGTLVDSFPILRNVNDVADRFGFRRIGRTSPCVMQTTWHRRSFAEN